MIDKVQILKELTYKMSRSSGKGGQNVNKVSTKVELRFDVKQSLFLSDDEKCRLIEKLRNRISNKGILVISCDTERTQLRNKTKVIELFFGLIEKALYIQKKRKKTTPTKSSVEKRIKDKKIKSEKKQQRRI